MKTKGIEKAIELARKNNYFLPSGFTVVGNNLQWVKYECKGTTSRAEVNIIDILRIIISKPFIEALAKGIDGTTGLGHLESTRIKTIRNGISLAIYNDTLEDYFTNLLNN